MEICVCVYSCQRAAVSRVVCVAIEWAECVEHTAVVPFCVGGRALASDQSQVALRTALPTPQPAATLSPTRFRRVTEMILLQPRPSRRFRPVLVPDVGVLPLSART